MKGGIDPFIVMLGIGLAIIALAYVSVYMRIPVSGGGQKTVISVPGNIPPREGIAEEYPSAGLVGKASEMAATAKKFGMFNASHLDEDVYSGNFSGRVFNGLLYGKRDATIIASLQNSSAHAEFSISSTNGYGRLMLIANNCTILDRKLGAGEYSETIPASCISNETTIRLHASSSLWRIWAPTVYDISHFRISQRRYVDRPAVLRFYIPEEVYDSLEKAYLTIVLPFHDGNITVSVNGKEIAEREARDEMVLHIPRDEFRKGENEMRISVSPGGYVRGTAELELFHYLEKEKAIEKIFYIDNSKMQMLEDGGEIRFFISKVYEPGGMAIEIRDGKNAERFIKYLPVHYGEYSVPVYSGNVSYGANRVVIRSVDGSAFVVDYVEVVV